ncbi:uncharacterized protein N7500_009426 [Penicillium coprophilum]|uniref:uncharacterized protein n=1 Tax=Penicillium coprophilum TaxID=36646 RepID=UPI002386C3BF|nr:uncharacterized protein N7500_009426 [Penicillium coprophilum]KAJ5153987.1 hypothetical protein N7500_009426 [Penicillium coprophilum]
MSQGFLRRRFYPLSDILSISQKGTWQSNPLPIQNLKLVLQLTSPSNLVTTPWQYNILASIAHWILLAGYLVIPRTFISLQKSNAIQDGLAENEVGKWILNTIQNPPLLATVYVLFVSGLAIMSWLFWEYRDNYI